MAEGTCGVTARDLNRLLWRGASGEVVALSDYGEGPRDLGARRPGRRWTLRGFAALVMLVAALFARPRSRSFRGEPALQRGKRRLVTMVMLAQALGSRRAAGGSGRCCALGLALRIVSHGPTPRRSSPTGRGSRSVGSPRATPPLPSPPPSAC